MVTTTITNDTTHVLRISEGAAGYYFDVLPDFLPGMKFDFDSWELFKDTYRCSLVIQRHGASSPAILHIHEDACEYREISVRTAPNGSEIWIGTKSREPLFFKQDTSFLVSRDLKDYKAKRNEASASIKRVVAVCNNLVLRLKMIKICRVQCRRLVQTLSKGIQELTEEYTKVFGVEDSIETLYYTRKLRILVHCLHTLEDWVRYTEMFLCTRNWKFLALEVSMPFRSPDTTTQSTFDRLIGELSWNLDKIRYALLSPLESARVEWKWCSIKCRHVLIGPGGSVDQSDGGSRSNRKRDRDYLTRHLENGSPIAQFQSPIMFKPWMWFLQDGSLFAQFQSPIMFKPWMWFLKDGSLFAQFQFPIMFKPWTWFLKDGSGEDFGAVLKHRLGLQNMSVSSLSTSSSIPPVKTFWTSHLHLKFKSEVTRGSFKAIYRGEWFELEVAIAIIVTEHVNESEFLVEKEAGHLADLQHPNVVAFYAYSFTDKPMLPASFTRKNESPPRAAGFLVMELMEEDLSRTIDKRMESTGPFSISVALDIMLQIAEAMVYLHGRDIMHRDLKPMNCLVKARLAPGSSNRDMYYDVKLTDFGSAKEDVMSKNTANPGTTLWMAPEMLRPNCAERVPYTKSVDVYGFAMICYQVITGKRVPEFPAYRNRVEFIKIVSEGERPSFRGSLSCPEDLKKLITDCWAGEPEKRPNFKEIRRQLWVLKRDAEVEL